MLACFMLSHRSHMLLYFYLFVICSDWVIFILFSRLLMHSSVSFSILFIASRVLYISDIELSIFLCVFFIFSSSLLKWSVLRWILFPNSVSIFIINSLNSLSGRLIISVSFFFFFQGFCLALSIESSSLPFHFTCSVSVNIGETVISCGPEVVFLCGSILM